MSAYLLGPSAFVLGALAMLAVGFVGGRLRRRRVSIVEISGVRPRVDRLELDWDEPEDRQRLGGLGQ